MNTPSKNGGGKKTVSEAALNTTIFVLLITGAFLGGWVANGGKGNELESQEPSQSLEEEIKNHLQTKQLSPPENTQEDSNQELKNTTELEKKQLITFVASKNGKKYYPIDCSASDNIKKENKIFFSSEEEAKSKGYSRTESKQCTPFF